MQRNTWKTIAAAMLAVIMLFSVLPLGALAEAIPTRTVDNIANFAATQEGTTGQYYYDNYNIDFEWCVWFTTYCASNLGLCGTPSNTTGGVFPPVERSTWESLNWAATGVTYQINWFAANNKGTFYYFGSRDSMLNSSSNIINTNRNDYVPQKGDLIYFDWEHDSHYNHVAIVYDYNASNGNVVYIGGNQGTGGNRYTRLVSRVTIASSSEDIVGYMRPNYPGSDGTREINLYTSGTSSNYAKGDYLRGRLTNVFNGVQLFTNSSVTYPLGSNMNVNAQYCVAGWCYGYQCYAYANGVYYYLFGDVPYHGGGGYNHSRVAMSNVATASYSNFKSAGIKVGAYLRTTGNSDGSYNGDSGHSLIILSYDSNYVFSVEGNVTGAGLSSGVFLIRRSWDSFNSSLLSGQGRRISHIVQPTDAYYTEIGEDDPVPSKPENLVVKTGIDTWIGWNPCTNTDSYDIRVYRQGETEAFMTIWSVNTTYCSCHLDPGTYRVTVCSVNETTHQWTSSDYTSYFTVSETYEYLPSNIVISDEHLYAFYNYDMGSWAEIKAFCEARGGHLATITSASENEVIYNLVKNSGKNSCRLGADNSSGSWKWVTGESFSYAPWASNEPNNTNKNEKYLEMYISSAAWNDNAMVTNTTECFVMEIELDSIAPAATVNYGGSTYLRYDVPLPWKEAETFCENLEGDGHLAVITSSIENNKIKELINGASGSKFLIGASDAETEGTWKWVNGETFNYNDWASGQPDNAHSVEDFALIDGSSGWYDSSAALAGNTGFICEMEGTCDHILQHVSAVEPTCTEDGHISYWFCPGCGKCYNDEAGENEISIESTIIPATGHTFVDEDVPATCINYAGVRHTCTVCGYSYVDYVGEYSDWSTEYPEGIDEDLIESRTEYRYRDYETTTSYEPSMSGWDLVSSTWEQSDAGNWDYVSSWAPGFDRNNSYYTQYNKAPKTASETTTDKLVINSTSTAGYLYWHWCRCDYWEGPIDRYISDEYTDTYWCFHCFYSTTAPSNYPSLTGSTNPPTCYQISNGSCCVDTYWYFCTNVTRQKWTSYRKLFTYGRWSDWSEWSPDPVEPTDTREVETRTVYRYVTGEYGDHVWNSGVITIPCTHEHDGEMTYTCTLCGATMTEVIPSPDTYTVTYYVDDEQYAQQLYWEDETIVLPEYTAPDGYYFSGWALQNGDPVPETMPANDISVYGVTIPNVVTVTFTGAYVGTQEVPFGGDAVLPVLDVEGLHYTFTVNGEPWDGMNITEDVTVEVGMEIDVYTVVFIDGVTGDVLSSQQVEYAESAIAPAVPEHYGYTFQGWDGEYNFITADTTVTAIYAPVTFTVIFTDGLDNIISVQEVPYLEAAEEPELPVREGWVFAGWDADFSCVTAPMVINATWQEQQITVTFTGSYNGTEIIAYGADCPLPVYNSSSICYTFKANGEDWCPENITEDVTVTVSVAPVKTTYHTITFIGFNGEVISAQSVQHGQAADIPEAPYVPGYRFVSWDRDVDMLSSVTYTCTRTAIYEEEETPEPTLPGDVDCNGVVDMSDVSMLFSYLNGATQLAPEGQANADVNGDGMISIMDISAIYGIIANS